MLSTINSAGASLREIHAADVQELAQRGWADEDSGVVKITPKGKQVRAEVEAETERLFFARGAYLSESDVVSGKQQASYNASHGLLVLHKSAYLAVSTAAIALESAHYARFS